MSKPDIASWDDVDLALRRLGEIDAAVDKINGDTLLRINEIKDEAKTKAAGLVKEHKALSEAVRGFCEDRKAEFAKLRSRRLTFGEIGYRLVREVSMPRTKDKVAALIQALKAFGCVECIQVDERPDREQIEKLDDATIAKLGLTRSVKDSFRIVPDKEAIAEGVA